MLDTLHERRTDVGDPGGGFFALDWIERHDRDAPHRLALLDVASGRRDT
ncbi:hypothetical protein [Defluviimonas salinarum]|uniref:Uncharacterized protein n=1 Tax=Defluviimonas salinarum TaxID=2992147 RepID=A0ABT3J8C9_9RHOB|nr:hypothetical protein [Defluviimonas salinarum]MCW3783639.1 hypothetical protein [Defluviimonas salinarum]